MKAVRFSWWLTSLTHHFPGAGPIDRKMQLAELGHIRLTACASRIYRELRRITLPEGTRLLLHFSSLLLAIRDKTSLEILSNFTVNTYVCQDKQELC